MRAIWLFFLRTDRSIKEIDPEIALIVAMRSR